MKTLLTLFTALVLSACAGVDVEHYAKQKPVLDLPQYFNGTLDAWGVFQKRNGEVARRFKVERADGAGATVEQFDRLAVRLVLRLLIGRGVAGEEQELGAVQADAVAAVAAAAAITTARCCRHLLTPRPSTPPPLPSLTTTLIHLTSRGSCQL